MNIPDRPEFTKEQEEWICWMIGEWYLHWKSKIAKGEHRLGFAKEQLKALLCDDKEFFESLIALYNCIENRKEV